MVVCFYINSIVISISGHCKKLAPVWDELSDALKDKVTVAKVDCTQDKDLCSIFEVKGYPTLKLFENGNVEAYTGGR